MPIGVQLQENGFLHALEDHQGGCAGRRLLLGPVICTAGHGRTAARPSGVTEGDRRALPVQMGGGQRGASSYGAGHVLRAGAGGSFLLSSPPWIRGGRRRGFHIENAPGSVELVAERDSRSTFHLSTFTGIYPIAWTASVC